MSEKICKQFSLLTIVLWSQTELMQHNFHESEDAMDWIQLTQLFSQSARLQRQYQLIKFIISKLLQQKMFIASEEFFAQTLLFCAFVESLPLSFASKMELEKMEFIV